MFNVKVSSSGDNLVAMGRLSTVIIEVEGR